tara:strand:+ start:4929 stop:5099 length:171 start_codon:yes stop_codon:yes gene_type:complete
LVARNVLLAWGAAEWGRDWRKVVEIWKEFAVGSFSIRNSPVIKAIADFIPISLNNF